MNLLFGWLLITTNFFLRYYNHHTSEWYLFLLFFMLISLWPNQIPIQNEENKLDYYYQEYHSLIEQVSNI